MDGPKVSVVIASHNAVGVIADCLAALQRQQVRQMVEVIVADSSTDGTADLIRQRFPDVRLFQFSSPLTLPQLRGAAIAEAGGELIAILDPHCIVDEGWLEELLRLHAVRPEPVIGGAVELELAGGQTMGRWATYLCEYSAFMPPLEEGAAVELTGNNIAYKRQALGNTAALRESGFWKTFFNRQLKTEGQQLWNAPSLVVKLRKPIPVAEFFRSRYHHGRCFAAMRFGRPRPLRAIGSPLLPFLALWRQARGFWPKHRHRAKFLAALPLLFLFHSSWAWGEFWGYLCGPGRSCNRLFY
jgi:glycosyltransferase involved in cell wall biosynthesis